MAPEVLSGKRFSEKVDVYSFALVLWEMLTGNEPFEEFDSYNRYLFLPPYFLILASLTPYAMIIVAQKFLRYSSCDPSSLISDH